MNNHVNQQLNLLIPHINYLTHACMQYAQKVNSLPSLSLLHFTGNAKCASVDAHPCLYHLVQGPLPIRHAYGDLSPCSSSMGTFSPSSTWRGPQEMLGHHVIKTSIIQHDAYVRTLKIITTCIHNNISYEYPIHKAHKHRTHNYQISMINT